MTTMSPKTKAAFLVTTEREESIAFRFVVENNLDAIIYNLPAEDGGCSINYSKCEYLMSLPEKEQWDRFMDGIAEVWVPDSLYATESAKLHKDYKVFVDSVKEAQDKASGIKLERVL